MAKRGPGLPVTAESRSIHEQVARLRNQGQTLAEIGAKFDFTPQNALYRLKYYVRTHPENRLSRSLVDKGLVPAA